MLCAGFSTDAGFWGTRAGATVDGPTCRGAEDAFAEQLRRHVGHLQRGGTGPGSAWVRRVCCAHQVMHGTTQPAANASANPAPRRGRPTAGLPNHRHRHRALTVPNVCVLISFLFPASTRLSPKSDTLATKPRRSVSEELSSTLAAWGAESDQVDIGNVHVVMSSTEQRSRFQISSQDCSLYQKSHTLLL